MSQALLNKSKGPYFFTPGIVRMFPEFQKASDKLRHFLQHRANFSAFLNHTSMAKARSKVQGLYELCQNAFTPSGPLPSSPAVKKLCSLLDTIAPADVGLKEENLDDDRGHGFFGMDQLNRVARWAPPITYLDIYECDSFTMCIFCFPTSSVIPLHDHPQMTVFSKVLYGSLHVRAYDWVEPAQEIQLAHNFTVRLAKLAVDKLLTAPCETSVLYPRSGGNIHHFTAVTPCAVLDILSPRYKEEAGRKCSYYRDYPYTTFAKVKGIKIEDGKEEEYAWLAETEPDNLYMRSGKYTGPTIQV